MGVGETACLHLRHAAIPARHFSDVPVPDVNVVPRMMAGVIAPRMTPCAMMRPCVSGSDGYGDRRRTQSQCHNTE